MVVELPLRGTFAKRPDNLVVLLIVVDGNGVVDEVADGLHGFFHGFTSVVFRSFGTVTNRDWEGRE